MTENVEVSPVELRQAAEITQGLGRSIRRAGEKLRDRLDPLEDESTMQPFGNDKLGKKFYDGAEGQNNGYRHSRQNLIDGVFGFADTVDSYAVGQFDAVRVLETGEESSTNSFK